MNKTNKQKLKNAPSVTMLDLVKRGEIAEYANLAETTRLSNSDTKKTQKGKSQ